MSEKRPAGEVIGAKPSSAEKPAPASPIRGSPIPAPRASRAQVNVSSQTAEVDGESRWWLQVGIGGYRIRALYDTGASRTVMGATGLQIATALNRPLMTNFERRAKVMGGTHGQHSGLRRIAI